MSATTIAPVKRNPRAKIDAGPCKACPLHPDGPCPACQQRRRRAVRLVEVDGLCIADAAYEMRISCERVERLLEEERDRRELQRFKLDRIDVAAIRELYEQRVRQDPDLTLVELARLAGFKCGTHVARVLGYKPSSRVKRPDGRCYPGRVAKTISVEHAGRLVRALGYDPHAIEGL